MSTELEITMQRIAELDKEIALEREQMNNTNVKEWFFLAKGFTNGMRFKDNKQDRFMRGYDYLSKTFKGTEKEFYNFLDNLEKEVDGFKLLDTGIVK
jgi:hypothetical protein